MFGALDEEYFLWLSAKVRHAVVPTPSNSHQKLLLKMYTTEYPWLLSGDDNRAADGKELRIQFLDQLQYNDEPEWRALPCSVLEMLIAFSRHAEFNTTEGTVYDWFWEMVTNLGIALQVDADYDDEFVEAVLNRFVWRQYDRKGRGGLFPIRRPHRDQTQVEIWYQFCDYLLDQDRLP
jgi:hypothetical protein